MSNANKEVVRRLYSEVMGKGNPRAADEIVASDYVDHMPIMETPDRTGLLKSVAAARNAFPEVEPRMATYRSAEALERQKKSDGTARFVQRLYPLIDRDSLVQPAGPVIANTGTGPGGNLGSER